MGNDWQNELFKILFRFADKNLFEQGIAKSIDRALRNGCTYSYSLEGNCQELTNYMHRYKTRDYKEICQLIAKSSLDCESNELKAALLLTRDVLIFRELERRPSVYSHISNHRDGLDCMNFLLDLINHAAGYTEKYYDE